MDGKQYSIGVFLDLSKAFDTIEHKIILKKLEIYGIRGIALQLFSSYLAGRTQFVSVDSGISNDAEIKYGVPQGSIIGPLLFIIYANDIVSASSVLKSILCADDTILFASRSNLDTLVDLINVGLDTWKIMSNILCDKNPPG